MQVRPYIASRQDLTVDKDVLCIMTLPPCYTVTRPLRAVMITYCVPWWARKLPFFVTTDTISYAGEVSQALRCCSVQQEAIPGILHVLGRNSTACMFNHMGWTGQCRTHRGGRHSRGNLLAVGDRGQASRDELLPVYLDKLQGARRDRC